MEKKFKGILSCLFGGRQKVQVTKFAFEEFIFVVGSAANSVGTTLEFAASGRDPDAKYSGASAFWFFLSTTLVVRRAENIFPGKHQDVHVHLSCHGKKISSKMNNSE